LLVWPDPELEPEPEPEPEPPAFDDLSVVPDAVELSDVAEQPNRPVRVIIADKQSVNFK
jgi:hypothetical protein